MQDGCIWAAIAQNVKRFINLRNCFMYNVYIYFPFMYLICRICVHHVVVDGGPRGVGGAHVPGLRSLGRPLGALVGGL